MNKYKTMFIISGVLDLLYSLVFLSVPVIALIFFGLAMVFFIASSKNVEDLYQSRNSYLIYGIIHLIFNQLAGILSIVAVSMIENEFNRKYPINTNGPNQYNGPYNNYNNQYNYNNQTYYQPPKPKKPKENIDPQAKKIDILLKLGVGMVFVSGILFATTSWSIITNLIKLIVLTLLGFMFLGLSIFSEKKLKIKNTTIMYWFLSMSFFFSIVLGIGYFGMLGEALSYKGELKDIMYSITFLYFSLLSAFTYYRFNNNKMLYVTYIGITLGIKLLITGVLPDIFSILIISLIVLFINLFVEKENSLFKYSSVLSIVLLYGVFYNLHCDYLSVFIITSVLNIINLTYLSTKVDQIDNNIMYLIITIIHLFLIGIASDSSTAYVLIMGIITTLVLLIRFNFIYKFKESKILSQILLFIVTIFLMIITAFDNALPVLLISSIYVIYHFIVMIDKKDTLEMYLQPLALMLLNISVIYLFNDNNIELKGSLCFLILGYIYTILSIVLPKKYNSIYKVSTLASIITASTLNTLDGSILIQAFTIIPITYYLIMNSVSGENNKTVKNISFIGLLLDIYLIIVCYSLFNTRLLNLLSVLIVYIILLIVNNKDEDLTCINNFLTVLPLLDSIITFDENLLDFRYLKLVLINLLEFYTLYILIKYACKDESSKETTGVIGSIFIILQVFFTQDLIVGVYVGIVGLIITFIGYFNKKFDALFKVGIGITAINIIYQLRELWGLLPFWLYLLVGGLAIIGFVTYIELKNEKKNEKNKKESK